MNTKTVEQFNSLNSNDLDTVVGGKVNWGQVG
ncbi:ComC/BlpC family leader-containing pheromone/bacteriocin [Streptococcus marmotae]|nr:ComC/BlpC family leader-containing pheromone/bacteriocin [Streptococcus marmotae]